MSHPHKTDMLKQYSPVTRAYSSIAGKDDTSSVSTDLCKLRENPIKKGSQSSSFLAI